MNLSGKVVLITGAGGDIGKAAAKAFAYAGAKLALVDINQDTLQKAAEELNLPEEDCLLLPANVANEEEVQNYVQQTKEMFGRIDVFFNNAGIEGKVAPITDITAENLEQVFNVNIKGVFYGLKHVMAIMMGQKSGSIINTSSLGGLKGVPGLAPYVASKHAVIGLTRTAAVEGAGSGVRVNAVCPGAVYSRMQSSIENGMAPDNPAAVRERISQNTPLQRYCKPEEVAQLVLFLASEQASFITGGYYIIDGGRMVG